eukprot:1985591-Pleurochrysis_carterae.AAC.3
MMHLCTHRLWISRPAHDAIIGYTYIVDCGRYRTYSKISHISTDNLRASGVVAKIEHGDCHTHFIWDIGHTSQHVHIIWLKQLKCLKHLVASGLEQKTHKKGRFSSLCGKLALWCLESGGVLHRRASAREELFMTNTCVA